MATSMKKAFSGDLNDDEGPVAKVQKIEPNGALNEVPSNSPDLASVEVPKVHTQGTDHPTSIVTEKDVGITKYISSHKGFNGVIKQRFSDFLVHEIDSDGHVVRLTDTSLPEDKKAPTANPVIGDCDVLSTEDQDKLKTLLQSNDRSSHVDIEVGDDKEARTAVHKAVRENFPGLFSETKDVDGKKVIRVGYSEGTHRGLGMKLNQWPRGKGDYCRFVLYKEGKDTMDAVSVMARFLRLKPSLFSYAGTKDRRGKTSQLVSAHKILPSKLLGLNKTLRGVILGNFSYTKDVIKLGDLTGNHFSVVLRNTDCNEEQVKQAMQSLQDIGFINYFGMQRFGTTDVPTHLIGKALLHSNWEEAVDLILRPRASKSDDIAQSRQIWQDTKDAKAALKCMKRQCMERHLLEGLSRCHKNDLLSAINNIPRNSRMMYVHSYQSYIWNTLVSRRIQQYGLKTIVGDLVIKVPGSCRTTPTVVTSDNIDDYSIHDVVMPLPGYDVIYPSNIVAEWYKEEVSKAGLDIGNMRHKVKDFSLPGDYRRVVMKPTDVSWKQYTYDDHTIPLVRSDSDIMNNLPEPEHKTDGKFSALKVEFSLPSSTYATMALREILKTDTSAAHQSSLNVVA